MTTHPNSARRASCGSAPWRGLGALLALLALMVGPPLALLVAVGNPVPQQAIVGGQITDAAVVGLLAGVVWLAWAQLAVVVAVEALAAVRGGALPRTLPGCGFSQHFARRLVVTASLVLAGTGPLVAATASASPAVAATAAADCRVEMPTTTAFRVVETASGADLLSTSPTASTSVHVPGREPVVQEALPAELSYVVRPPKGHRYDSLWDIAERHLGDGMRWREIYDLNRHRPQHDGQRLELARLIQPGWRLIMPADATGLPTEKAKARSAEGPPSQATAHVAPAEAATPSLPHARQADAVQTPSSSTTARSRPVLVGPTVTVPSPLAAASDPGVRAVQEIATPATESEDGEIPFGQLTLGLGAVACAGLVAELSRRRRRAQRFRRPGERLPRPAEAAASVERQLRAANAELTVTDLRDALRLLAHECRTRGRALPDVSAVTLNAAGATLHLGTVADPVSPFVAGGDGTWCLDSTLLAGADRSDLAEDGLDPYPALVSLGVTDDAVLLVNLEAAGTLTIAGQAAETTPILHALIAELGTSLLSSTAHLVLTDCPHELAAVLDHGRVTLLAPDEADRWAHARGRDVTSILHASSVPDVGGARTAGVADDVWAPAVFFIGGASNDAPEARAGVSVVRVAEGAGTGWALHRTDNTWTLDPLGLSLTPQRFDLAAGPLAEALAMAQTPAAVPGNPGSAVPSSAPAQEPAVALDRDLGPAHSPAVAAPILTVPRQAAPADEPSAPAAPRVLVLGPIEITGVADDGAPGRRRRATELIAYLSLHSGATQYQLDEALWPGCRVSRNTRNPLVSRTRQWLGTDFAGQPFLGLVADDGKYSLSAEVRCDWHDFRALAERGMAAGTAGMDDLAAALKLVRGRPFLGVHPAAYGWAEADAQDMISAIVDVAEALGTLAGAAGDFRRVQWAAARGLAAEPVAERLHLMAAQAATAAGDQAEAERIVARLRRCIQGLDPEDDLDPGVATELLKNGAR